MRITTARLVLRDLNMSDAKSLAENINDINVIKWLLTVKYPYRLKDAVQWINECEKKRKEKPRQSYEFGIDLKSEKRIVGGIGLSKIDDYGGTATVGYWLGSRYHRQGYGAEAIGALIDFAFGNLKLRRLEAEVFVGNPSSGKLLEKCRFKKEGTRKKSKRSKSDGKLRDEWIYGLLKEDYHTHNYD